MIKDFLKSQRADLVFLQKTKLKSVDQSVVRSLGAERWLEWGAVNAEGPSGGMIIPGPPMRGLRAFYLLRNHKTVGSSV